MQTTAQSAALKETSSPPRKLRGNGRGDKNRARRGAGARDHFVQFYKDGQFLVESVASFVGSGLGAGEAAIVIATPEHRDAIAKKLSEQGIDLAVVQSRGQYVELDAAKTLAQFMVKGSPDEKRFKKVVGEVVQKTGQGRRGLRAFGEMVALLWADGNGAAAIRLEEFWNRLGQEHSFCLFCAYPLNGFGEAANGGDFAHICERHSRVLPAEGYLERSDSERLREVAAMQQKALALETEVSLRKRFEETLRRREAELTDFVEHASIGLHWVGPDGIIQWANKADFELLGYTAEEYIGRHIAEFHADRAVIDDILARLTAGERLRDYEARLKCKNGAIKTVLIDSSVLRENGQFIHTQCFTRDITEKKRVEEELRVSSRLPAENPAPVLRVSRDGTLHFANPKAREFFTEWNARIGEIVPAPILQLMRDPARHDTEIRAGERLYSVAVVPVDGEFINLYFNDITEQKRAEEKIRQSEQRFRQLLSLMPSAVYTCDENGRISFYNRRAAELWGREPALGDDDQKFCGAFKLWLPDGSLLPHAQTPMAVAVREGASCRDREVVIERPDGSRVTVCVNIDPLFDANGVRCGAINVFQDITGRKNAEEELRRHRSQLELELADSQLLQEISAALVREDNEHAIYEKLMDAAATVMRSDMACIQVVDEHEDALRLLTWRGFDQTFGDLFMWCRHDSLTCCSLARRTGQRVIVPDAEEWDFIANTPAIEEFRKLGVAAVQSTPLTSRSGKLVGMITTHWRQPHKPAERDLRLLDILARQAADLLERRQAEWEKRRRSERLELLSETLGQLLSARDPDTIVRELFPKVAAHLGVDTYFNFMVNPAGDALLLHSCAGIPDETARSITRLEFGQAICGTVAQTRQPIHATDIQKSNYDKAALVRGFGIQCYACNPLMVGNRLLGTLSFASRTRTAFDADEIQFLQIISQYTAVALDRLRQSEQLRESEERFRAVLDNSIAVIYVKDCDGRYLLINARHEQLFHVSKDKMLGRTDEEIFPADVAARFRENDLTVLRTGQPLEIEEVAPHDDGRHSYISIKFPLRRADGSIYAVAGISTDITLRKKAEQALAVRARQQRAVAELGVAALEDPDLQKLFDRAVEVVAQTLEVDYCKILELLPGGASVLLRSGVGWKRGLVGNATVSTGRDSQAGFTLLSSRPVIVEDLRAETRFSGPPLLHEHGVVSGVSCIIMGHDGPWGVLGAHSIAQRQFAEDDVAFMQAVANVLASSIQNKRAQQSVARLAAIVEHSEDAIFSIDLDAIIRSWNRGAQRLFGYTADEVIGKPFKLLTPGDADDEEPLILNRIRAGEAIEHYETLRRRKDGTLLNISLTVSPIKDACGNVTGASKVARDITEKVRAREILERTVNERTASLREALEQMEEFSYSVSHDLRGPLRAMSAYAGVLLEEYGTQLDGTARGYLEKIQRSSERMNRLTQDVLAYSRVARSQAQPETVELEPLVRDVIHQHTSLQPPAAEIEIVGPLPAVLGHETTLGQCVSNLLNNAVKFVAPGVEPHVRIRADSNDKYVRVWFEDNGIGIKPEHQQRIFKMFERVHPQGKYDGTGIGLTIVRKAVEKMGGKIGVESDGHNGSRFWIELGRAK